MSGLSTACAPPSTVVAIFRASSYCFSSRCAFAASWPVHLGPQPLRGPASQACARHILQCDATYSFTPFLPRSTWCAINSKPACLAYASMAARWRCCRGSLSRQTLAARARAQVGNGWCAESFCMCHAAIGTGASLPRPAPSVGWTRLDRRPRYRLRRESRGRAATLRLEVIRRASPDGPAARAPLAVFDAVDLRWFLPAWFPVLVMAFGRSKNTKDHLAMHSDPIIDRFCSVVRAEPAAKLPSPHPSPLASRSTSGKPRNRSRRIALGLGFWIGAASRALYAD